MVAILDNEISFTFSRSSGRGGQNVNKVSTKATLRWNVFESKVLNLEQKQIIARKLKNRMDGEGNLILYAQSERSQLQNRKEATEKLQNLVSEALKPEKKRLKTKPTKSSREKRLAEKKLDSAKKKSRGKVFCD